MIYVDADACPVKDEIATIAIRHDCQAIFVCNGGIRPYPHDLISLKIVPLGPDEADKWIADTIMAGDILVTNDIPLAAKAITKQTLALTTDGTLLTEANIGNKLAGRDLMADVRAADPFFQSKSKPYTKSDKSRFCQQLDHLLQKNRKTSS